MNRVPLEDFLEQGIAMSTGMPLGVIREQMSKCSCEWSDDFRARMEAAIRKNGRDPASVISKPSSHTHQV